MSICKKNCEQGCAPMQNGQGEKAVKLPLICNHSHLLAATCIVTVCVASSQFHLESALNSLELLV